LDVQSVSWHGARLADSSDTRYGLDIVGHLGERLQVLQECGMTALVDLVRADLTAMMEGQTLSTKRLLLRLAVHARWRAVIALRVAQRSMRQPLTRPLGLFLSDRILIGSGAELRPTSSIGPGLVLKHTTGIVVGGEVVAGERLTLHQNVTLGDRRPFGGQPRLGDDVTIGAGACVLGPITIGDRVVVAANSVVLDDVPSDSLVGGIPAQVLRRLTAVPDPR